MPDISLGKSARRPAFGEPCITRLALQVRSGSAPGQAGSTLRVEKSNMIKPPRSGSLTCRIWVSSRTSQKYPEDREEQYDINPQSQTGKKKTASVEVVQAESLIKGKGY